MIVFVTDATQQPYNIGETNELVEASQLMYKKSVTIFAVAIGQYVNKLQLDAIVRDSSLMYHVDTFASLVTDSTVNEIGLKLIAGIKNRM